MEIEEKHQATMTQVENYVVKQEKVVAQWKTCFSQLATLANGAVSGVPEMLREAKTSLLFSILQMKSILFIKHC